jgi:teichuronic acid biosynthesis glycosyltransferase TuaG
MDLISVIIPYYKKKQFIDASIKSVINQTYSNLEIILIYDDNDKSDLKYLTQKYDLNEKIKFSVNDKNIGAGLSRNKGMKLAKGNYICFIDADDIWEKNKLETQLLFMKNTGSVISHTSYMIINEKDDLIGTRVAKNFSNIQEIIKSCDIGLSSVMLKKEIINDDIQFPNLKTKEDFVLWLKILKLGKEISAIDQNLLSWRRTENSLSSSIFQKLLDGFRVYNKFMGYNFFTSIYYLLCLSINYVIKRFND